MTSYLAYFLVYFVLPFIFAIIITVVVGVVGCCCLTPDKMVRIVFPYIKKDGKHITIFGFIAKKQFVHTQYITMLIIVVFTMYVVLTNAFLKVSNKYNPYDDLECFFTNQSRVEQLSPDEAIDLEEEVRCFAWNIDIAGAVGRATGTLAFSWIIVSIMIWLTLQLGHKFKENLLKNATSKTDKMMKNCIRVLLRVIQLTTYIGPFLIIGLAITSLVLGWIPNYSYLEIGLFAIIFSSGFIQWRLVMKQPENIKDYCGQLVLTFEQPGETLELIEAFKKMTREHLSELDRIIPKVGAANEDNEEEKTKEIEDKSSDTETDISDTETDISDTETEISYIETESNVIGSDRSSGVLVEIEDGDNNKEEAQKDERGGKKSKELNRKSNNPDDNTPDQTPEEKYKKDKDALEEMEETCERSSKENENYFKKVLKTAISIENRSFKLREKKLKLDEKECERQNYLNKSARTMGMEEDGSIIDEATLKKERKKNKKKSERLTRKTKRWEKKRKQHETQTLKTIKLFNDILQERLRLRKVRKKLRNRVDMAEAIKLERQKIALEQTELNIVEEKQKLLRIKLLREMAETECKKALASEAAFYVTKEEMHTITSAAFAKVLLKYMFDDEDELSTSTKTTPLDDKEHQKPPRNGYAGLEEEP